MRQEGDVHAVHGELLLPELKAGVLLLQLCQGLLQLGGRRGEEDGLGGQADKPQTRPGSTGAGGRGCRASPRKGKGR